MTLYGCNTNSPVYKPRLDGYLAQDGWNTDGTRAMEYVKDDMSKDGKYDRRAVDPKCTGCRRCK